MRVLAIAFLLLGCGGAAPIRYLALGDSFTAGTGSSPEEAFPARLAQALRAGGTDVVLENAAVNGYTSADVLSREVPLLASFHPTYVTLAVGANDIVRGHDAVEYRTNVHAIVAAVIAAGVPPRNLVGLPQPEWPRSPVGERFDATVTLVRSYDAILREEIEAVGGRWAALEALQEDEASAGAWARDDLHPDADCHAAWARALARDAAPTR